MAIEPSRCPPRSDHVSLYHEPSGIAISNHIVHNHASILPASAATGKGRRERAGSSPQLAGATAFRSLNLYHQPPPNRSRMGSHQSRMQPWWLVPDLPAVAIEKPERASRPAFSADASQTPQIAHPTRPITPLSHFPAADPIAEATHVHRGRTRGRGARRGKPTSRETSPSASQSWRSALK